jgi:hypothetical protein
MTQKEQIKQRAALKKIRAKGERKLRRDELKRARQEYWPPYKPPTTSKLALAYIFASCTAVQIYSMIAMWHFGDLSALYSLIGATVGEAISYCAYAAKSAKENTVGGITHDLAMLQQQATAPEAPAEAPSEDEIPCG